MVRLFDSTYSISEYQEHLGRLLGLFEPLEHAAARSAEPSDLVHLLQRAGDIREDLLMMGATSAEVDRLERCRRLPPIPAQGLFGYAYVILGSLMGAKVIVKQLRAVLGPSASVQFYGDGNGRYAALWPVFLQNLEEKGQHNIPAICATAEGIFDAYQAWLTQ
jgi:heme oxygenase